jgi:hypothetical protein
MAALLSIRDHPPLRTEDDLNALLIEVAKTAETEQATLEALGDDAEFALRTWAKAFPLTWSDRVRDALTLGADTLGILKEQSAALSDLMKLAQTLPAAITKDGLPVPREAIARVLDFRLQFADAANPEGTAVANFARATIRYMQLRFVGNFALM